MPRSLPARVYQRRRWAAAAGAVMVLALLALTAARLTSGSDDPQARAAATTASDTDPRASRHATAGDGATTTTTSSTGRFTRATGDSAVVGSGILYRYAVEVEEGTGVDVATFAEAVDATLADPRGWTAVDGIRLQRVADQVVQFTVRLATPATTDVLCAPLTTEGEASCGHDRMAVINLTRWLEGAAPSKLDLAGYRDYVVTHEVGHLLGHAHEPCPGPGQLAPTMMQQTYGIGPCVPNPWPVPGG